MPCEICEGKMSYRRVCRDGVSSIETCDSCYEKTFVGGLFLQNEKLRSEVEKLRKYRRNARRAYRELQMAYERLCNRVNERAQYAEMMEVAKQYYQALEGADRKSSEELEALKEYLDVVSEPFSDDPAFIAFLNMKRASKLGV